MSSSAASNSIDFDFFENEGWQTKVHSKQQKQSDSSTIITTAVIETKPDLPELDYTENLIDKHSGQPLKRPTEGRLSNHRNQSDCLSSPSSSLEKKLLGLDDAALVNLMNCLAYNEDEGYDNRVSQSSSPNSLDTKESPDISLTDSTVTTVTSDFTCISPLSSSSLCSSSCDSMSDEHDENSDVSECKPEIERPTDLSVLTEDGNKEPSHSNSIEEKFYELKESDETGSSNECDDGDKKNESHDENSNSPEPYESDFESYNEQNYLDKNSKGLVVKKDEQDITLSDEESQVSTLEDELGNTSISQSRSSSVKTSYKKRKNCNLTFSREEIMRIERDNLILLKKIMAHSKHKPVSLNQQPFSHKKTSTAINRAKQQKKIEQDNYILYSKISAMGRLKKVF